MAVKCALRTARYDHYRTELRMKIAEHDSARISPKFARGTHRDFDCVSDRPLAHALFFPDQRMPAWTRTVRVLKNAPHPMATMYDFSARDLTSSNPAHIRHRAQTHALSKPIQKAPSLLRVCLRFLCATASRSVPSVAIMESIKDSRGQDCCDP